ncbi:MAG TPA: glycosyltransferase [Allosphingosinicella sp.]|nr:glycosyltransferase [Allosphingosinicella sp.]
MRFVVFGLTISSSWGNGHATLWRGLVRALTAMGHEVRFFERDVPYYAGTRDIHGLWDGAELILYSSWEDVLDRARAEVARADAAIVTSYCVDAIAASHLILDRAPGARLFYDLDTPVTLARLTAGETVSYLPPEGLGGFDLVLSYTGGEALRRLRDELGAERVAPLYGHVDPTCHRPAAPVESFRADLSYIGTYAADRQAGVERLFVEPAEARPDLRFLLAGSCYPADLHWPANVAFLEHLPPAEHPAFFSSSRLTLNVTRADMAALGFSPSGRLFEAAACGCPLVTDVWTGLDLFFSPGDELIAAESSDDVLGALQLSDAELARIARAARERVLGEHTSAHRARELIGFLEEEDDDEAAARPVPLAAAGG